MKEDKEKAISPWNMLDSYTEGQVIYGRKKEISTIVDNIQLNIQTLLYGKSGVGKTSLLQAGVFPELRRRGFFPIVIRLALYTDRNYAEIIKRKVIEEAKREALEINKSSLTPEFLVDDAPEKPLWEFFSKTRFIDANGAEYSPVLVFDQFEENINNQDHWQDSADFLRNDLYELLEENLVPQHPCLDYTNYRIIISMREDYLYAFEDIVDRFDLKEFKYNRFRITALDDSNATEVIMNTFGPGGLQSGQEMEIVDGIIRKAKAASSSRFEEISTPILSLTCSLLYANAEDGVVFLKDLKDVDAYIYTYYSDVCRLIGSQATEYLEKELLTKDGRRKQLDKREALKSRKIRGKDISLLQKNRIIRIVKTDTNDQSIEFIHDIFARMVARRRMKVKDVVGMGHLMDGASDGREFWLKTIKYAFVAAICLCLLVLFHAKLRHDTWNPFVCKPTMATWSYCVLWWLLLYVIPFAVRRMHDAGYSGLRLFLLPFTFFYLLNKSSRKVKRPNLSLKLSNAFKGVPVDNKDYTLALGYEFILMIISCCVVGCIFGVWKIYLPYLVLFHESLPDSLATKLFFPIVLAYLPLTLFFSSALRARLKGMGWSKTLVWIPFLNVIVCLIGLLPNKTLAKFHLINVENLPHDGFAEDGNLSSPISSEDMKTSTTEVHPLFILLCFPVAYLSVSVPMLSLLSWISNNRYFRMHRIEFAPFQSFWRSLAVFLVPLYPLFYWSEMYRQKRLFFYLLNKEHSSVGAVVMRVICTLWNLGALCALFAFLFDK